MTIVAEKPQTPVHFPQDEITYIRNMAKKLSTEELEYRLNIFFMPLPSDEQQQFSQTKQEEKNKK